MAESVRSGVDRPALLFVYGTLMRDGGGPAHGHLARGAKYLGKGRVPGRLYDLGRYPGAIPSPRRPSPEVGGWAAGEIVHGELYHLHDPDPTLRTLDEHEGCGPRDVAPTEFYRAVATVRADDGGEVAAWIYWYGRAVEAATRISTGSWAGRAVARLDR